MIKSKSKKDTLVETSVFSFISNATFILALLFSLFIIILLIVHWFDLYPETTSVIYKTVYKFLNRSTYIFGIMLFLSLIYSLVYGALRYSRIAKPVKEIVKSTQEISDGNFSYRIETKETAKKNEFDVIIDNINIMAQELESIETLRTDFIANVSHELKTPLAVIKNYCDEIQDPAVSKEEALQYAKSASNYCMLMSELVTNILKLNKLENQEVNINNVPFDVTESIRSVVLSYEQSWEGKNIELEFNMPEYLLMNGEPELFGLAFANLFSNAVKYTNEGGIITLNVEDKQDRICVSVADTGCGFDDSVKERIFEKFYQGDTSHKSKGNGLGLALVQRVCYILGADIEVESAPGEGSRFTLIFKK